MNEHDHPGHEQTAHGHLHRRAHPRDDGAHLRRIRDLERFLAGVGEVNAATDVLEVSATSGEGLPAWFEWLRALAFKPPPGADRASG